jgi:CRISPR-associated endonuclease/helicase Cas3
MSFDDFFKRLTGYRPHRWQMGLASDPVCRDRLIRIPTGFGKTAGVTVAWLWNRVHRRDASWPCRLVLCLPMRTLAEQTHREVCRWLERAGLDPERQAHVLLGGLSPSDWHLEPERESVLIGTQDMLLSRALNRGYGAGRARWPMEFGLLNVDCLWVMDEVQLMGVGLATSAQLQAFAYQDEESGKLPRPRRTWWMSATLQRDWMRRAPALSGVLESLPTIELDPSERTGALWDVEKTLELRTLPAAADANLQAWARLIAEVHEESGKGLTLVVANTVESAVKLRAALRSRLGSTVDLRLVHSRFRGAERTRWTQEFLGREHCGPGRNRVIVATQVVEAGVDISADVLVTEVAPWASLVQRFGRCARYGGRGRIIVVDRRHTDESARAIVGKTKEARDEKRREDDSKIVLPYALTEIEAAVEALGLLTQGGGSVGPGALERVERQGSEGTLLSRLYPYEPLHILTRQDLEDLFDTTPDLSGADVDISRFVREGEDRDVSVWWWPVPEGQGPHARIRPSHDALCRIPVRDAKRWLVGSTTSRGDEDESSGEAGSGTKRRVRPRAWVWSYLDGEWERLEERHIYPGQTILVDATAGGYDVDDGFTGKPGTLPVEASHARGVAAADAADAADEDDELSEGVGDARRQYKTIATHVSETARCVRAIATAAGLEDTSNEVEALEMAGMLHDLGKSHPAFAAAIRDRNGIPSELPLAKAPKGRWHSLRELYDHSPLGKRPGFRHELASALGLLELVWRAAPDHPGLQGGREELLVATVGREVPEGDRLAEPNGLITRLVERDESTLNLVLYLVMSHHGKVRSILAMSPKDQDNIGPDGNLPIRGVREGDMIPELVLADSSGREFRLPELCLHLDPARLGLSRRYGPSWAERIALLRKHYGSFHLAWLEALLRAADVEASAIGEPPDPRIPGEQVAVRDIPESENDDAGLRRWIADTLAAYERIEDAQSRRSKASQRSKDVSRASASAD